MVQPSIERQIQFGRVIKGLNFIGDAENEVKEILTLNKHAKAIVASSNDAQLRANQKNTKRRNVLGNFIPECNPYRPVCNMEMNPQQRERRTVNHVQLLTYQWYQCATKARNDEIKALYLEKLRRIKPTTS